MGDFTRYVYAVYMAALQLLGYNSDSSDWTTYAFFSRSVTHALVGARLASAGMGSYSKRTRQRPEFGLMDPTSTDLEATESQRLGHTRGGPSRLTASTRASCSRGGTS